MACPTSALDLARRSFATRVVEDEQAQTLSEYAVVLTVITAAIVLAIALLGTNIGNHISDIAKLIVP